MNHPSPQPPGPSPAQPRPPARPGRPADVETGFWLWLAALPLMTIGYVVHLVTSPQVGPGAMLYPAVGLIAVVICVVVVTFLILMRSGYRWARTALTGGGVAAVVYAVSSLSEADPRPSVAVVCAVTGIIGSVLIVGGVFLLHRTEAQGYFAGSPETRR